MFCALPWWFTALRSNTSTCTYCCVWCLVCKWAMHCVSYALRIPSGIPRQCGVLTGMLKAIIVAHTEMWGTAHLTARIHACLTRAGLSDRQEQLLPGQPREKDSSILQHAFV